MAKPGLAGTWRHECKTDQAVSGRPHHDVAVVDETGALVAKARISESVEGFEKLLSLLARPVTATAHQCR